MAGHLDGCWVKLDRAREHLDGLASEIKAAVADPSNVTVLRPQFDVKQTNCYIQVQSVPDYPLLRWGVMVGDILHNLRSALDHLAWQLYKTGCARLTSKEEGRIVFPICRTVDDFRSKLNTHLGGVSWVQRALVYEYQPCARYHDTTLSPLYRLQSLSNDDKHQVVTPVVFPTKGQDLPGFRGNDNNEILGETWIAYQSLEPGAYVAVLQVRVTGPQPEVYIDGSLPTYVAFGDGLNADFYLAAMMSNVEQVLSDFQPFFDSLTS
jgi:hypothetical protein